MKRKSIELEKFIVKARRRLLETEVMLSEWDYQNGKYWKINSLDYLVKKKRK